MLACSAAPAVGKHSDTHGTIRLMSTVACPCCGYLTLDQEGLFNLCDVCGWEDDPDARGDAEARNANGIRLVAAQANMPDSALTTKTRFTGCAHRVRSSSHRTRHGPRREDQLICASVTEYTPRNIRSRSPASYAVAGCASMRLWILSRRWSGRSVNGTN